MDRTGANFEADLESIHERLTKNAVAVQIPIGAEDKFEGTIDLITQKAHYYEGQMGEKIEEKDIPDDYKEKAKQWREKMIESVVEQDDALTEKYLNGEEISEEEIKKTLRKATLSYKLVPVFCGTALKNKGVQPVLDAIVEYLPAPNDLPDIKGIDPKTEEEATRKTDDSENFSAIAFKVAIDPFVGRLIYFRVYSGTLESGSYVYNSISGKKERISRIVRMHADKREEVKEVYTGEIAAIVGLKETSTGDTLCDMDNPIILEKITFPEPVISVAVEPKTKADQEKMGNALRDLASEDPTFRIKSDEETGQTIISGMGELHLEIIIDRMKREFKVDANIAIVSFLGGK
jgi:elongation factor G